MRHGSANAYQGVMNSLGTPPSAEVCASARISGKSYLSDHPEGDRMTRPDNSDAPPEAAGGGEE